AAPPAKPQYVVAVQPPRPSMQSLEQRIFDLLLPFRDECYASSAGGTATSERKTLVLCENIAFIIRHNQFSYGKEVFADDVSIACRGWSAMMDGKGGASIGVFVNGNGYTHTIMRAHVAQGDAVERLSEECDKALQNFF
ncbi:hypothetical protein BDW02DRAFT_474657, partial [Decorospora gaudefroyi]